MDEFLKGKMDERVRTQQNPMNIQDFNEKLDNAGDQAMANFNAMQGEIDRELFSGAKATQAKGKNDYTRSYLTDEMEERVRYINGRVDDNIQKYGKAEPTQADIDAKKEKLSFKKIWNSIAEVATAATGKLGTHQQSVLENLKEINPHADITTVIEMEKLIKYTNFFRDHLNMNGSKFKDFAKNQLKGVKRDQLEEAKKKAFGEYRYGILPFLKTYKKGWFGRYYNLDGKRIKVGSNELNPADYNKMILNGMKLDTDASRVKDKKVLAANRKKKAAVLTTITREILEECDAFDPKKLTDKYVAEHIVELRQFADRINSFRYLFKDNQWFFAGKDIAPNKSLLKEAKDPDFIHMLSVKITGIAGPLSTYLDAHLATHGIQSNTQFKSRKFGFRTYDAEEKKAIQFMDIDSMPLIRVEARYSTEEEQVDRIMAFGNAYDVVDTTTMNAQDLETYNKNMTFERGIFANGSHYQMLQNRFKANRDRLNKPLSKDVYNIVQKDLSVYEQAAKKEVNDLIKGGMEITNIPYLRVSGEDAGGAGMDLYDIRRKVQLGRNSEIYMYYGPEIDHLYGKFYATCRLETELLAKKRVLDQKFRISQRRNMEKDLNNPNISQLVKTDLHKRIDAIRKDNEKLCFQKSNNPYAKFCDNRIRQSRIDCAIGEYDEIDRKLEYIRYNRKVGKATLNYLLRDPSKNYQDPKGMSEVSRYLAKENLAYMLEMEKIESYDKLFDEALEKVEIDQRKEAGKDAEVQRLHETRLMNRRERGGRIYNVRRRARQCRETQKAVKDFRYVSPQDSVLFEKIITMKPEEFTQYNFLGRIPMHKDPLHPNRAQDKEVQFRNLTFMRMCQAAHSNSGLFSTKYYTNRVDMLMEFEALKRKKVIPAKLGFEQFLVDVSIKMDMLKERHDYVVAMFNDQTDVNFAYVDTDKLEAMNTNSLMKLRKHLQDKEKVLKAQFEEVAGKDGIKLQQLDFQENGQEDKKAKDDRKWMMRRRKREYENCKQLIAFVERRYFILDSMSKQEAFTEQTYQHKYTTRMTDVWIRQARINEYAFADEDYLVIRQALKDVAKKKYRTDISSTFYRKKESDKNFMKDDKKVMKEIMVYVNRLRTVQIGPELLETIKRNMEVGNHPNGAELAELVRLADTVSNLRTLRDAELLWAGEDAVAARTVLEKPENAALLAEIKSKIAILEPVEMLVEDYVNSKGFASSRGASPLQGFTKEDVRGKEEEKRGEIETFENKVAEGISRLASNLKNAEFISGKNYIGLLYKRLAENGMQLSIHRIADWKKELEKIARNKKVAAEDGDAQGIQLAAKQVLAEWPYSFEDFYATHESAVTAEALRQSIENYTGVKDAFGIDTGEAGEIAKVIAKETTNCYRGVSVDTRKQLDVALKNSGYDITAFRHLFEKVEVSATGEPADSTSIGNRSANENLAQCFLERNKDGGKSLDEESRMKWNTMALSILYNVARVRIQPEMMTEKYLQEHFEYVYSLSKTYKAAQDIYNHEQELLADAKVCEACYQSPANIRTIHNAFSPKSENVYETFFLAVEAYAKAHFVDEEGKFDLGLQAEMKQEDRKSINKSRMKGMLKQRKLVFENLSGDVRAQVNRPMIAAQISKANEVNTTLDAIKITGNSTLLPVVQKENFAGNLGDMNLLFQDKDLQEVVDKYHDAMRKISENKEKIAKLTKKAMAIQAKGENTLPVREQIMVLQAEINPLLAYIGSYKQEIEEIQKNNKVVYEKYTKCHGKNGELLTDKVKVEGGTEYSVIGNFIEFHATLAEEMTEIYEAFKKTLENDPNLMKPEEIEKKILKADWSTIMHNYQRLDLYLGLYEQDRQYFKESKKKKKMNDLIAKQKEAGIRIYNDYCKTDKSIQVADIRHELARKANGLSYTQTLFKTLDEDMKKKGGPVEKFHQYMQAIYATIKRNGVTIDGKIERDRILEHGQGNINEAEGMEIFRSATHKQAEFLHEINMLEPVETRERKNTRRNTKKK